jgi:two-component system, chemotaxis family, response regulator Rcp1
LRSKDGFVQITTEQAARSGIAVGRSAEVVTHVLLVEDSPGDVRLMQEAFRDSKRPIKLHVATDGVEALAFLKNEGPYADAPRPTIILLDLNMPRMDGRELLALIKQDKDLKTIPTLVLTISDAEADILQSYQLQANCYLRKPAEWEAFDLIVRSINDFWLTKVELPQAHIGGG